MFIILKCFINIILNKLQLSVIIYEIVLLSDRYLSFFIKIPINYIKLYEILHHIHYKY